MLDAFAWDSEAEDEWEEEESETGAISAVVGMLTKNLFFPLILLMLIYSLLKASIGESWDFTAGTTKGNDGNLFITTSYTFVANFFGIFTTVLDTVASPLSSLLRRDEALRELSQNYWVGVFEPALPSYLSQQRKLPIVIGGGLVVAALQFMGCPFYAAALTMIGMTVTGRSFPDLWAMSNIAPLAAPYGGQGAGMWMPTATPPLAYL